MNKKYIAIVVVIILVILGISVFVFENKQNTSSNDNSTVVNTTATTTPKDSDSNSSATVNKTASTSTSPMKSTGQLFSKSADFAKAYLIYPTADSSAQKALAGFSVITKDLGNGTVQVSLPTKTQTDEVQSFIITPGQKVYFVEKSMGDDSLDTDRNYSDDYRVAVDANGFILQ